MSFPGGSMVSNPPVKQETQVQSLGWEDPVEKEMATNSSILVWVQGLMVSRLLLWLSREKIIMGKE